MAAVEGSETGLSGGTLLTCPPPIGYMCEGWRRGGGSSGSVNEIGEWVIGALLLGSAQRNKTTSILLEVFDKIY